MESTGVRINKATIHFVDDKYKVSYDWQGRTGKTDLGKPMTFDEAIEEVRKYLNTPKRKIDKDRFRDWISGERLGTGDMMWNIGKKEEMLGIDNGIAIAVVTGNREDEARLVASAPEVMRRLIDFVNAYIRGGLVEESIQRLIEVIESAGFGCDIERDE